MIQRHFTAIASTPAALLLALLAAACASPDRAAAIGDGSAASAPPTSTTASQTAAPGSKAQQAPRPASAPAQRRPAAQQQAYFELEHDGRIFVVGSEQSWAALQRQPALVYSMNKVSAGPAGQTVVVEIDKDDPALQDRLWDEYRSRHLYYEEVQHDGRYYVLGSRESVADFKQTEHMTYTETIIGYGPGGATAVFEVDPKQPRLQQRLRREFDQRHRYYAEERYDGRIFVIGERELHEEFLQTRHMIYTQTYIGRGPGRATLVFQLDPKDDRLLQRLQREFTARHAIEL